MVTVHRSARVTCDAVRSLSFAACDGELSSAECVVLDAHLQRCAACRRHCTADAVFLRAVRHAATHDAAPRSLRDRIERILQPRATENASA